MDGLLLVDKPEGLTSHDVVLKLRRALGQRRIGHFGTLDPLATGLLLVGVGKATRLFPVFSRLNKAYSCLIRLGLATDTYDATGTPISAPSQDFPPEKEIIRAMAGLTGTIDQLPPPYSAKKVGGKPLYQWARSKRPVDLKPHRVTVSTFQLRRYIPPDLEVDIECSSGTYVRSLAHDLGQRLGCGGHVVRLCRQRVGNFHLADATSLEKIEALIGQNRSQEFLLPLESLFAEWPKLILIPGKERGLGKNRPIHPQEVAGFFEDKAKAAEPGEVIIRLFSSRGRFLGLAHPDRKRGGVLPFLLLG